MRLECLVYFGLIDSINAAGRNMRGTDANGFVQVLCVDSTKYALLMNYSTTNKHNVPVLKLDL